MNFHSNIKLLRKRKRRTQDDVSRVLGIKRSTLSGYENGVAMPNIQALIDLSRYFNVSIDTLIKVDLAKLSESQLQQLEQGYDVFVSGSRIRILATTIDSQNNENIELVPEKAKAGYTTGFADTEFISSLPVFQLPFLSGERKYRTFQISGDSMLPIPDGAWVTGEYLQNWNELKEQEAYIILTLEDGVVFKKIEKIKTNEGQLLLSSLNPMYKNYELAISEVKEIWAFTHFISKEMPQAGMDTGELARNISGLRKDIGDIKSKLRI